MEKGSVTKEESWKKWVSKNLTECKIENLEEHLSEVFDFDVLKRLEEKLETFKGEISKTSLDTLELLNGMSIYYRASCILSVLDEKFHTDTEKDEFWGIIVDKDADIERACWILLDAIERGSPEEND